MRALHAVLAAALSGATLAAVSDDAAAGPKICSSRLQTAAMAGKVNLPCQIRNEKVVVITNNTGHPIDASRTPFSYEAIGKYDQKHWCQTFTGGTLAPGSETQIGAQPFSSCTAWYKPPLLMQQ
jgi:hypothetical protein